MVVAPGAAGLGGLFQNQEIVAALLAQAHGQAQAGKPGTDDQHAQGRMLGSIVRHCALREPPCRR
ncbi:hypothetical protein D3C78_1560560 [compost metagenome]